MIPRTPLRERLAARDPSCSRRRIGTPRTRTETHQHTLASRSQADRDSSLADMVHRALMTMDGNRLRRVSVVVKNGQVRLIGRVKTYYARQLALHAAMSVEGVTEVLDELEVE